MRSLRLAMIAHGIPEAETAALAALLRIGTLEDVQDMHFVAFLRVPHAFRYRILALRNRHKRAGDDDWLVPADVNWLQFDVVFWAGVVQYTGEHDL